MKFGTIYFLFSIFIAFESQGQETKNNRSDTKIIIEPVEHSARFPGGIDSLSSFIKRNLRQPTKTKKKGTVFIEFTVDKDGKPSDFKIVRGLTKECDNRALEVVKKCRRGFRGQLIIFQ